MPLFLSRFTSGQLINNIFKNSGSKFFLPHDESIKCRLLPKSEWQFYLQDRGTPQFIEFTIRQATGLDIPKRHYDNLKSPKRHLFPIDYKYRFSSSWYLYVRKSF